jgi:predicted transcriptional regulator
MERHPEFVVRADMRGDLRVSVLASLRFDAGAGQSELALARAAGGSRAQVRNALDNLEMTGRVRRLSAGGRAGAGVIGIDSRAGAPIRNATRIELLRFG